MALAPTIAVELITFTQFLREKNFHPYYAIAGGTGDAARNHQADFMPRNAARRSIWQPKVRAATAAPPSAWLIPRASPKQYTT